jgi:hypothetical protein
VAVDGDPAAAAMALVRVNPYWTYQEDVILNGNPAQAALDWEQQERAQVASHVEPVATSERLRFLEVNAHLPAQGAPASDWEQQERGEVAP